MRQNTDKAVNKEYIYYKEQAQRIETLLKEQPLRFFKYNILHYCTHDEMMALRDWLNTYEKKSENKLPVFLRTNSGKKPTVGQHKKLIELLKESGK